MLKKLHRKTAIALTVAAGLLVAEIGRAHV